MLGAVSIQEVDMRVTRKSIAAAFRRMARGVKAKQAYAAAVSFYRSGGQPWTKQLA
jgi:hypothetical protein